MTRPDALAAMHGLGITLLLLVPLWPVVVAYLLVKLILGRPLEWGQELRVATPYAVAFWALFLVGLLTVLKTPG